MELKYFCKEAKKRMQKNTLNREIEKKTQTTNTYLHAHTKTISPKKKFVRDLIILKVSDNNNNNRPITTTTTTTIDNRMWSSDVNNTLSLVVVKWCLSVFISFHWWSGLSMVRFDCCYGYKHKTTMMKMNGNWWLWFGFHYQCCCLVNKNQMTPTDRPTKWIWNGNTCVHIFFSLYNWQQ